MNIFIINIFAGRPLCIILLREKSSWNFVHSRIDNRTLFFNITIKMQVFKVSDFLDFTEYMKMLENIDLAIFCSYVVICAVSTVITIFCGFIFIFTIYSVLPV